MAIKVFLDRFPVLCAAMALPWLLLGCSAPPPTAPGTGPSTGGPPDVASCIGTRWRDAESGVAVGAIRWDAWFGGSTYERFLDPEEWHSRLPFYGRILSPSLVQVDSDSGVVMDQEIAFAAAAGLSYWAFNYYHPDAFAGADSFNYGLRRYLSSPCRDQINFSLILQGSWLGPTQEWPTTVSGFADLLTNPGYHRVAGGRPLLYFFDIEAMGHRFGSWAGARAAVDELRAAARTAGSRDPYIVGLANPARRAAELADILGFDAIGAYSAIGSGTDGDRPYADLRRANEVFWAEALATGKSVVAPLSVGWDPRPRLAASAPGHGPILWYRAPQPDELRQHVQGAVSWTEAQAPAGSGTVLIYAWNEHDEGGWLTPTRSEGTTRLEAIEAALRRLSPQVRRLAFQAKN